MDSISAFLMRPLNGPVIADRFFVALQLEVFLEIKEGG